MSTPEFRNNRDNFCYRHPDRQSFVLCQRCLRTICPDCQTPAAVGVVCPECLKAQQKARTPAQVKADRRWGRSTAAPMSAYGGRPVMTYGITAVTGLVYLFQLIPGLPVQEWLLLFAPWLYPELTGTFEPWRLFTVLLVHSSFWHVGLNMLALWMLGRSLEPLLGRWRFLTLYLLSGLGGSVAVALLGFTTPVVGASGAIFGLFGALLVIGRNIGANISGIAIVLAINLALSFAPLVVRALGGSTAGPGVSWQAHIGGLAAGALVGYVYAKTRSARQRRLQIGMLVAVGVGLVALLLLPPVFYG